MAECTLGKNPVKFTVKNWPKSTVKTALFLCLFTLLRNVLKCFQMSFNWRVNSEMWNINLANRHLQMNSVAVCVQGRVAGMPCLQPAALHVLDVLGVH